MDKFKNIPIFPEYLMKFNETTLECVHETIIRKQKDGIWYDIITKDKFIAKNNSAFCIGLITQNFIKKVYIEILFLDIDDLILREYHKESPLQISEEQRIKEYAFR